MQNIRTLYARLVKHSLDWSRAVKRANTLAPLLLRAVVLVMGNLSVERVKITYGFARRVVSLHRYLGSRGLALYLKTAFVLLQQSLGGMRGTAPSAIGMNIARTRTGIPRLIDRRDRRRLLAGDVTVIRIWLTMLGLYRALDFRGKLKLSTITAPGVDLSANGVLTLWAKWLPIFVERLAIETGLEAKIPRHAVDGSLRLTPNLIPLIRKSSPNSGGLSSVAALPLDIVAWTFAPLKLQTAMSIYLQAVGGEELVWALKPHIDAVREYKEVITERETECIRGGNPFAANPFTADPQRAHHGPWEPESRVRITRKTIYKCLESWGPVMALGRLGFKHEPGKIRVFAMCDAITQALVDPLHEWIFKRLRAIGTDGTFNQDMPLARLIKRMNDPSKSFVASYDLSAATDRLPLILQQMILEQVGNGRFARAWATLLVERPYKLPREAKSWNLGFDEVRYTVGQPMGALSSWAMLAITHHCIVQLAAFKAGLTRKGGWFQDYGVLGDDIVIANESVASEYLKIMNLIGVEIGLAKSLVSSQGTFEFAKRTYYKGQDVTGISLMEISVGLANLSALMELIRKNLKFERIRVSTAARFAGFGYRNLGSIGTSWAKGNRLGRLLACLHQPGGVWPVSLGEWLTAVGPGGAIKEISKPWTIAQGLWTELINSAVARIVKIEQLLPHLGLYNYSYGENRPFSKEEREMARAGKKFVVRDGMMAVQGYLGKPGKGLMGVLSEHAFNDFFREWVARPYHDGLRRQVKLADEVLRQHDPYHLPEWKALDELWTELFGYKRDASGFPTRVAILSRKNDEITIREGGRTLALWLKLRRILRSKASVLLTLASQTRTWPKATRRWDRGLGQDRVNMGSSYIVDEFNQAKQQWGSVLDAMHQEWTSKAEKPKDSKTK